MTDSSRFESFDEFDAAVEVLPEDQSDRLRSGFVKRFVDVDHPGYKENVAQLQTYADGDAYVGYLWDYLVTKVVVTCDELRRKLDAAHLVNVMWDVHSAQRVRDPDYFKWPKSTVLRGSVAVMCRGAAFLPEDIYVFDETLTWTAALTHEWLDDTRYCLWADAAS